MALSKEQLLLLNNLIYTINDQQLKTGNNYHTVSEWINSASMSNLVEGNDPGGSFMTAEDWRKIRQAVKNDPALLNLRIVTTHVDNAPNGGGGVSMIFTDDSTKEAVVLFKGTEGGEWKDNFIGGNVTDTEQQKNALKWYQDAYKEYGLDQYDVTVTGHSKGGNKSKYITIQDDSVDRCVSFDGQGFSDKFMNEYSDKIAARQNKIENHNVDYDYVNLLLNDIGETTYYKGKDIGNGGGGFLESHCPNSYMEWNEDGTFSMEKCPDGQPAEMKAVDEFLNNCLRSLDDEDKDKMLSMIHKFVMFGFGVSEKSTEDNWNDFKDIMHDPDSADALPYLIAYFIQYERNNPEIADQIRDAMIKFGFEDYLKYVDIAESILNFNYDKDLLFGHIHLDFDDIMNVINGAAGLIDADWILNILVKLIKDKAGLDVNKDDLRLLLKMVNKVDQDMEMIHIEDNGADITINPDRSAAGSSGAGHQFRVEPDKIRKAASNLHAAAGDLQNFAGKAKDCSNKINFEISSAFRIKMSILRSEGNLIGITEKMGALAATLGIVLSEYEGTENRLSS